MSLTQRPRHSTHARLFFTSLFSSARHVSRRSRLWKTVGGAVAALLAVGMVATGVSLAASASTTDPTGSSTSAACVESPAYSYTYVAATASGVITVTAGDAAEGTPLCSPLYVRAATWTYDRPTKGGTPSWPQTLEGYNDVTANMIGTFSYGSPEVNTCKQHDIYATFDTTGFTKLALPHNLYDSHNPSEPMFLHEALSSAANGTNSPTYSTDASIDCPAPTVPTCSSTSGTVITSLSSLDLSETRTQGHVELVQNGLHIWTTGPDLSLSKSAGYIATDFALKDAGVPALGYTTTSGASAGLNLTLYVNGAWKGNLVYEPLFAKYWINKAIAGLPAGPNPSYQLAYGTLDEILQAYANDAVTDLRIKAVGYSLGSGAIGDGIVNSITAGCTTYTFTAPPPLTPTTIVTDPEVVSQTCVNETTLTSGYITVAVTDHVKYSIVGTSEGSTVNIADASAKTLLVPGDYTVSATADAGFVLAGEHVGPWHLTVNAFDGVCSQGPTLASLPTAVSSTNQVCSAGVATGGSITVAQIGGNDNQFAQGVSYFIDGVKVTSVTTVKASGTYHVTATVDNPQDTIDGDSSWTITVAAPSTDCAQLKTLAFTGADGSMGGMLIFALFLLLGGAGVYTASRFRSRES
jgi:hypothetical protein